MKFFTDKPTTSSKEKVMDVKTLLKLARQYLDGNNYKKAQQCCRKVLRVNDKNYMALVLLGKSFGKRADAVPSFQQALSIKPDHPLAWQGLAHYYEVKKDESSKVNLLNIYNKILFLDIDEESAIKTIKKYAELGYLLKNIDTITTLIQYMKVEKNVALKEVAKTEIMQLLKLNLLCKPEDVPDIINILKNLNQSDLGEDEPELILLGNLILQTTDFKTAIEDILALEKFQNSNVMKNWMCKLLCETFIRQNTLYGFELNTYVNQITNGMEYSKYGGILIAITYYMHCMFEEAYEKCISVVKDNLDVVDEIDALFMLKCSKMTPNNMRTINLCKYFLEKQYLHNPNFVKNINETFLYCYIKDKDFIKALYHVTQIPVDCMESMTLTDMGDLYLELDHVSDTTWEILQSTDYLELFKAFDHIKYKKFPEAIEVLLLYEKHPIKYYYLALAYWFIDDNENSFKNFQKAAELISGHPKIYYCLGIHYFRHKYDIEESRRWFEKSYSLCRTDNNVIKMLSIIYVRQSLFDLEFELLQAAYKLPETREFWICIRLGSICYRRGIMDEALKYLESSIIMNPQEVIAQELIGDVYFNKNDYASALTAYNKVIELTDQSAIYFKCLNRVGSIYSEQALYHKAIYVFDNVLDSDPGNILALKGVTENRVIFALKQVAQNLFQDARDQMQCAVNRIVTAMSLGIKDLIYWSLYGDVLVFMARLPNEFSFVNLQNPEGETKKEKLEMYRMAIESYCNVLKYRDSFALFKCALIYFEYYCEVKDIVLCKISYNLAVLYMKINPNVWPIWDLLGKICFHLNKCETAYFCSSKALSLSEDSEFKLPCDLGLFYLKLDKHELANYKHVIEMFDISTFAPPWINEELSDTFLTNNDTSEFEDIDTLDVDDVEELQFTECMRTFEPSSTESREPGFELPIEALKLVPNSADIIEWYLCTEEESTWTCYSLGKIQESKGLLLSAIRYYDRGYMVANDREKNDMLSNKGRLLMKINEYEEAINVYDKMHEKNFHDTCAFASALQKMKNYKKAYAAYEVAFNYLCENDDQRVDILITMSNIAYRLNGLCAAATILLKAVKIKCGENQDFNIPFMKAYVFKRVDIPLVAYVMTEHLFKHMETATWWYYMGLNYLRGVKKNSRLSIACIKRAIRSNTVSCRNGQLYALICLAEFYSGDRQKALSVATGALRLYPVQPDLWAIFVLCIKTDRNWPRKAAFLRVVVDTVRKFVYVTPSLNRWLLKVEEEIINPQKKRNFANAFNSDVA